MLDRDLAELYSVTTSNLKRQVRRNIDRFPPDFMFVLTREEINRMVCHFGTPFRSTLGGAKPFAFTEHGILMLSSVLTSKRAIRVNIQIMRAFSRLRHVLSTNKELTFLFKELKHKVDRHDVEIGLVIRAIEKMIEGEQKPKRKIGFVTGKN